MKNSISASVSKLIIGLTFTITCIYSLFLIAYSWIIQDSIFNRQVAAEAEYIQSHFEKFNQVLLPRSGFMTLHENWQSVPNEIATLYPFEKERVEYTLNDGRTIHINVFSLANKEYILTADVAAFEVNRDFSPRLIQLLVLSAITCCILVGIIAFYAGRSITLPLKRLASNIQKQTLFDDKKNHYPDNEIGMLAKTITQSFTELEQALSRETNFTKDISHEIRTPITIFKNILATHHANSPLSEPEITQLQQVNHDLEQITETLLALARNESVIKAQFNLAELIENCVISHFALNNTEQGKNLNLTINLPEQFLISANQNLTTILVNNLLSNMVQYASEQAVSISLTKQSLVFSNAFNQPMPENITQSGTRAANSQGIGHGLALITRICDMNQWQLKTRHLDTKFDLTIYF